MNDETGAPVDIGELMQRCMGEAEFAQAMLNRFLNSAGTGLDGIEERIAAGDVESAAREVHRLKGTAATVAARPLHRSLEILERIVRSGGPDAARLKAEFATARREHGRLAEFIRTSSAFACAGKCADSGAGSGSC